MQATSPHDILSAYSRGDLSSSKAIALLGFAGYLDLVVAMSDAGHPLPRPPGDELEAQVQAALPLLRAVLVPEAGMLDLVIPDTGPLITLGLVGRLDLLDRFKCPILVTDMILAEVGRGPDTALDKAAFDRWFVARGNRIQIVETLFGAMWASLPDERRREIKRMFPNAGEQSIQEFTDRVAQMLPAGDQVLVLFEEDQVKRIRFGPHVHLLHTFGFLLTLERLGVIPSADAFHAAVAARGRTIAKDVFERRATSSGGDVPDWQEDYEVTPIR